MGWTWWERLLFWGPFFFGVALLIWGDSDRMFAAILVGIPVAVFSWGAWRVIRERRAEQRGTRQ